MTHPQSQPYLPVLSCPMCGTEMSEVPLESSGAMGRVCLSCKGYWFERGDLARWLETRDDLPEFKLYIFQAEKGHLSCPECHARGLLEMPYSSAESILANWCPDCRGIWLNVGELTDVVRLGEHLRGESQKDKPRQSVSPSLLWFFFLGLSLAAGYWVASWLAT